MGSLARPHFFCASANPMPSRSPSTMPTPRMYAASIKKMRRICPLDVPNAFSTPIMLVRSKMMINNALAMLMMATSTISTITTITLVSSSSSQENTSGYCCRAVMVRRPGPMKSL